MNSESHPPAVEVSQEVMGGTPVFAGSRLPIETIIASVDAGFTVSQLQESWPWLTTEHVHAARVYAAGHDIRVRPWALTVDDEHVVELTVAVSLFPEVLQVRAQTADGSQYVLTPNTPGVRAELLVPGQRLRCRVTRRLPRVLDAEPIASDNSMPPGAE